MILPNKLKNITYHFYEDIEVMVIKFYASLCESSGVEIPRTLDDIQIDGKMHIESNEIVGSLNEDPDSDITMNGHELIQSYKEQGFWGYVDKPRKEMHLWYDASIANREDFLFLIGHEFQHFLYTDKQIKRFIKKRKPNISKDEFLAIFDELRADQGGYLANALYKFLIDRQGLWLPL